MNSTDTVQRLKVSGRAIPLPGDDIDTDRIIPARYLRCITFEDLGSFAFYDERFDAKGNPKDHPFNDKRFKGGEILLVNRNFGCGSSREHAPQSLMRMGIRAIAGESFAEIFAGNCTSLGIPAVKLSHEDVLRLMKMVENNPSLQLEIDLEKKIITAGNEKIPLDMPESYRKSLVSGAWDTTSSLLEGMTDIRAAADRLPYLYGFRG